MTDPGRYRDLDRAEVEPFVPTEAQSVLDVGCYRGAFGSLVKQRRPLVTVTGVEPDASAAAIAATRLDHVITGVFPDDVPATRFDCIVFNDVLEHVVDPWTLLRTTADHLAPRGRIVASIPNVRHYFVLRDLLLRGEWTYVDEGVLDRTHLRFFTRRTMCRLFEGAGYRVDDIAPINLEDYGRLGRLLGHFGRRFDEFRARQYVVVATAGPTTNQKLPP